MAALSRIVAERLYQSGYRQVVKDDRSVAGVPGWTILIEAGGPEPVPGIIKGHRGSARLAVVFCRTLSDCEDLYVASPGRHVCTSAEEVIRGTLSPKVVASARAIIRQVDRRSGKQSAHGTFCILALDDWIQLMLAWRLFGLRMRGREGSSSPSPSEALPSAPPSPGQTFLDYNKVRERQVREDAAEEVKRFGRLLFSSSAGWAASKDAAEGDVDGGSVVDEEAERRSGPRGTGRKGGKHG